MAGKVERREGKRDPSAAETNSTVSVAGLKIIPEESFQQGPNRLTGGRVKSMAAEVDPLARHRDAGRHPTKTITALQQGDVVAFLGRQQRSGQTGRTAPNYNQPHPAVCPGRATVLNPDVQLGRLPDMSTWKKALVTGASSGIGASFAQQLSAAGTDLVVVARNEQKLNELKADLSSSVEVLVADLADPAELARVEQRLEVGDIDLLVNNAGFGENGPFLSHERDVESQMVAVNITALQRLMHAGAAPMVAAGSGAIINIASVAAFVAAPNSATYAATKSFVLSLSEGLASELAPKGVTVTCVCPGLTRTEFQDRGGYDVSKMPDAAWQTADEVVSASLDAARDGKRVLVPGVQNKLLVGATKTMPAPLLRKLAESFF